MRRRRRRANERRRVGTRRIELSLNENFFFQIGTASLEKHFEFWDGGGGEPTGIEGQRKQERINSGPSELRR